ncbi:hypothetical protein [Chitinophaga sp. YIM B06452]|uniref:hypothetical protein n=1 Tax=Chitinophaga sp. YIM B06452 TaxID=3082158 RepID=UPI0031FF3D82
MKKIIIISLAAIGLCACSKEGDLQEKDSYREVFAQGFSLDPNARFVVAVNNTQLTDSLVSTGAIRKVIKTPGETQQIKVSDYRSGQLLYDTLLATPGAKFNVTILQLDATGKQKPVFISSGGNADNIPAQHVSLGIYCTSADLPDSFALRIYRLNFDPTGSEITGVDTLTRFEVIRKGQLSEFKLIDFSRDPYLNFYAFEPRDIKTGEVLPGGEVDPVNFVAPLLAVNPTQDKHIICNIDGVLMPDNRYSFWSSVLVSY